MRALDDLVRQGKILYVGVSDAPAWWVAQANTLAHLRGWSPFIAMQIEYSLIERTVESTQHRRHRLVAPRRRNSQRQISRQRFVRRQRPHEQRNGERLPARPKTRRSRR